MQGHVLDEVAGDLVWLVDRSLATLSHLLAGNTSPPDDLGSSEQGGDPFRLVRIAYARGGAEFAVFEHDPPEDIGTVSGKMEAELRCVLETLDGLSDRYLRDARSAVDIAGSERRGRRRKPRNALEATVLGLPWEKPSKRRAGRAAAVPITDEELVTLVDTGRRDFGDRTARASLRRFADSRVSAEHSGGESAWRRREAAEKLVSNLEKRLSRVRSALPK